MINSIKINQIKLSNKQALTLLSAISILATCAMPAFADPTFAQRHPRRTEVLGRDRFESRQLQADRGNLGGHYNQLRRQSIAIRKQEQHDARMDGGHITRGEQRQLNREENHLQRHINRDTTL